ncbi:MAG: hypothetical protein H7320_12855 [Ferruginibacter sp.]|nr:hypothetical protein [Ferruginibacter sp.]
MKNLTVSQTERGNILNNNFTIKEVYDCLDFTSVMFEGRFRLNRNMITNYFGVKEKTIDRFLNQYTTESGQNEYGIITGNRLRLLVHVADNRIYKDLLFEIISSLIYEEDYSEELKLKMIHSIS